MVWIPLPYAESQPRLYGTTMTLRFNMPSSFRVPALHRSRRSTHRLRSFHLSPTEAATNFRRADPQASMGGTNPLPPERTKLQPNFVVPLSGSTIVTLAIIASIFFVISVSLAFLGAHIEDPYYKDSLDKVAETSPGVRSICIVSISHLNFRFADRFIWGERGRGCGWTVNNNPLVHFGLRSGLCITWIHWRPWK